MLFVIDSCIEIYDGDDDTIPYKVYGTYNSKEQAIKELNKIKNHLQDKYANNILYAWDYNDEFSIQFTYREPGDHADFEQVAVLTYEVREMSTPDSILNTTLNGLGANIHKIMFRDND